MDRSKLLIVDDDEDIRVSMKWALSVDYQVWLAEDRDGAMELFTRERPAVVTLDLGLPPHPHGAEEGFKLLAEMLERDPLVKVVVITGQDDKRNAIKAIGEGAYDFFCKPIQVDELKVVLNRVFRVSQLERQHLALQANLSSETFDGLLGTSPQMQEVFATVQKIAGTDVAVLIVGESGTGKELVARAIHGRSARREGPFVAINCAAIPENLLESELFGHEKGAFTGAHTKRKGRIELADAGTLFLDEIGDLSLGLQVKLLRFLQEHHIDRVGGRAEITVDTRVIAATNADLQRAMSENRFREDLYYRLGVVTIAIPPLREREGDVLFLAQAFMRKYAADNKRKITGFTQTALRALEAHGWPGNVRELENRINRAVIMAHGPKLNVEDLQLASPDSTYEGLGLKEARENLERDLIQQALAKNKGNLSRAAVELGISRPTLYELMDKLNIARK
jgi:two-component system, NtrC family, response regulator